MSVAVQPVSEILRPAVLALRVHAEQVPFVGTMPGVLHVAENDPRCEPMAMLADGEVVGYYRLDFNEGAIAGRNFGEETVGLRAFFVSAERQGQGLGTRGMRALIADLRARYPQARLLALGVNFRNEGAIHVYEKIGFIRTGEPYLGALPGRST